MKDDAAAWSGTLDDEHARRRKEMAWSAGTTPTHWDAPTSQDKKAWRVDGILPVPATSARSSLFSSLSAFIRDNLFPPNRSAARRPSISLTNAPSSLAVTPSWSTLRFILLCSLWYTTSALSSNTGKAILNLFRYPATLTIVQFAFVAGYCLLCANPVYGMTAIRRPTRAILRSTIPMAVFQVGGHMFSSVAISRIPVSTVHTIKALSPMFTVATYALLFGVQYTAATYMSLVPLTVGVMLACSFDVSAADFLGLVSAFMSAIVFVTSNIFFKKIMPSAPTTSGPTAVPAQKLDKLNLLFYSSGMAFVLMIPVWLSSDLGRLMTLWSSETPTTASSKYSHGLLYYFIVNGTVHFAQNLIAFAILASTSPVTYSIASLIKRIAVICIAVVWFNQHVHPIQGLGICLTFVGLWMYNSAKADVERGENKMRRIEAQSHVLLPTTRDEIRSVDSPPPSERPENIQPSYALSSAIGRPQYHPTSVPLPPPLPHKHTPSASLSQHPRAPPPLDIRLASKPNVQGHPHPHSTANAQPSSPTGSYPSPPPSLDSPRNSGQYFEEVGPMSPLHSRNRKGLNPESEGVGAIVVSGKDQSPVINGLAT